MAAQSFDVVIAGGGLAGSSLGGVLATSGLGVLVAERGFRTGTRRTDFSLGHFEALRAGLGELLDQASNRDATASS